MPEPWRILNLELQVEDKKYVVEPINYDDGLELQLVLQGKSKRIGPKASQDELFKLVLTPNLWDTIKAEQPFNVVFRAGMAAIAYQSDIVMGVDMEQAVKDGTVAWESGVDPEAVAAALEKATAANTQAIQSTPTGTAPTTRRPASTSTTTSRQGTKRPAKAASRSTGSRSPKRGTQSSPTSAPNTS